MAKYVVKKKCYGFLNKYWEIGDILETDDSTIVPKYFERVDKPKSNIQVKEVSKDGEKPDIDKGNKMDSFKNKNLK